MSASTEESALAAERPSAGAFRRILLKLSGEALMGGRDFGIDLPTVESLAREILDVHDGGVEVAIVIRSRSAADARPVRTLLNSWRVLSIDLSMRRVASARNSSIAAITPPLSAWR